VRQSAAKSPARDEGANGEDEQLYLIQRMSEASIGGYIMNQPLRTFISYKWENKQVTDWVEKFARDLRQNGIDALLDKWEVAYGESFVDYMITKIPAADVFLFVITPGSVAAVEAQGKTGGAVKFENEIARAQTIAGEELRFIPVLLQGDGPPKHLRGTRYIDFRDPARYAESFAALVDDLKGKQKKPPILGFGSLEYDARIYRMLPAVAGSPVRQIMAQHEPFPGFSFYSHRSDHPSQWPPRVYEDRERQTAGMRAFFDDPKYKAAIAKALAKDATKIEHLSSKVRNSQEERDARMLQDYAKLRLSFNLNLGKDAKKLQKLLGKEAAQGFLDLERDWQAADAGMPNRIFTLGFRHEHGRALRNVSLTMELVGTIYDIMLDHQRPLTREEQAAVGAGHRFALRLGDRPEGTTSILRIWYHYISLAERFDAQPIHFRGEPTQGVLLHSLGADGVSPVHVNSIVEDEEVYEPCAVELRVPEK
jgi:hypothetical protein